MAYYKTELTGQILTSTKAKEAIGKLAPVYGEAYVFLWLLQAVGGQLDKVGELIEDFQKQTVVQTATWSIGEWEKRYGIPIDENLSLEKRRAAVLAKMWSGCSMPPARIELIAKNAFGADVRIYENPGGYTFSIEIISRPCLVSETDVRELVDELRPAHLTYNVSYKEESFGNLTIGGAVQKYKSAQLKLQHPLYDEDYKEEISGSLTIGGVILKKDRTIVLTQAGNAPTLRITQAADTWVQLGANENVILGEGDTFYLYNCTADTVSRLSVSDGIYMELSADIPPGYTAECRIIKNYSFDGEQENGYIKIESVFLDGWIS